MRRWISLGVFASVWIVALPAWSQETAGEAQQPEAAASAPAKIERQVPEAKSLAELLDLVRKGWRDERVEDRKREEEFKRARADQKKLLADAKAALAREEKRSERLELSFQENELGLAELEE